MNNSIQKNKKMRRALIVGINHYKGGPLDGCINDAKNMYEVLNRHDDGSFKSALDEIRSNYNDKNYITTDSLSDIQLQLDLYYFHFERVKFQRYYE